MPGAKLCGELEPDREDQTCCRRDGHEGKHRDRRGSTWANRSPRPQYRRYVPPHRRTEGETYDTTGRRYRRPDGGEQPDPASGSPATPAPADVNSVSTQTLAG